MVLDYVTEIMNGSSRAVARLISWLENDDERARPCMEKLYSHTGNAYIIGITGSPGAGKSTLTDRLTQTLRKLGLTVGIIAVDPSSPFTGGAVLGDRVRMARLTEDPGVYIRSMATRGFLGGVAKATGEVIKVLDAFGKDIVIIETVGVGQDEVDIIGLADTTCLLLVPGLGDAVQSMKAGVMEIADIFIINKADHPGVDQLWAELHSRIEQDAHIRSREWISPVAKTIAVENEGIAGLWEAIQKHRHYLETSGQLLERRRDRMHREILNMIRNELFSQVYHHLTESGQLNKYIEDIVNLRKNPYHVMQKVVTDWIRIPNEYNESRTGS